MVTSRKGESWGEGVKMKKRQKEGENTQIALLVSPISNTVMTKK